jgi:hypothetical protein
MPAVEYTVKRPRNHPGPPILRLLLKGIERRMKKGGETIAKLDPEKDAKIVRDLGAAGYKVAPAVAEETPEEAAEAAQAIEESIPLPRTRRAAKPVEPEGEGS